jgi:hypothetical protein
VGREQAVWKHRAEADASTVVVTDPIATIKGDKCPGGARPTRAYPHMADQSNNRVDPTAPRLAVVDEHGKQQSVPVDRVTVQT